MPPALSDCDSDEEFNDDLSETGLKVVPAAPAVIPIETVEKVYQKKIEYLQTDDNDNDSESSEVSLAPSGTPPSAQQMVTDEGEEGFSSLPPPVQVKGKKPGILAGLDLHNIIYVSDDDNATTDYVTPPSSSVRTTRQQVRGAMKVDLQYNASYHPLDDYIRPKRAAKVRFLYHARVNHIKAEEMGSDFDSDSDQESLKLESGSESEEEEEETVKQERMKMLNGKGIKTERSPMRRSTRATQQSHVVYNINIHPQDKELEELGIRGRKRRAVEILDDDDGDDEDAPPYQRKNQKKDRVSAIVARHAARPQKRTARAESIVSRKSDAATYGPVLYAEGFEAFDVAPGQRYFRHENDALFSGKLPIQGDFRIHEETLEAQRAAEDHARPTKYFVDHLKENEDEAEDEPVNTTMDQEDQEARVFDRSTQPVLAEVDREMNAMDVPCVTSEYEEDLEL